MNTAQSSPLVKIENLSFGFNNQAPLFANINIEMGAGECLGLTGPSGCGKSTLAQIVAGHLKPNSGAVYIGNKNRTGTPSRDVFLVHQDLDLFPWQRVAQQIAFGMKTPDKAKIQSLLQLSKLTDVKNYYPAQLSGGMKKRLSIARALAVEPKLIIFDESFTSLDIGLRQEIFSELKEIWKKTQTTILLISHDPRDISAIAERELDFASLI